MNMNKIKYAVISTLAVLGLTLTSCEDFFDNTSPSAIPPHIAFGDIEAIEASLQGAYRLLMENDRIYRNRLSNGHQGMNTDIEFNTTSGANNMTRYNTELTNNQVTDPDNPSRDAWTMFTEFIDLMNIAIEEIQLVNEGTTQLYAEALTMRAFAYLEMIKFWGDVPAFFTPKNPADPASLNPPKADRNIIFEQLRQDLKYAAKLLEWSENLTVDYSFARTRNNITRANKAFALGLLARNNMMYAGKALRATESKNGVPLRRGMTYAVQYNTDDAGLRRELYQEALNATGEIIAHYGTSKLLPSFEQVFRDLCEDKTSFTGTEWIWVMPFQNGQRGQFMNYNSIGLHSSVREATWLKNVSTNSHNRSARIVPSFIYDFESNDERKWVTVAPFTWRADDAAGIASDVNVRRDMFPGTENNPAQVRLFQDNVSNAGTGIYIGKYRAEWMNRAIEGPDDGIDYPVMRYADILLMHAEASIGGISGDVPGTVPAMSGQDAFNLIRARAGLPDKVLNMENIIDERSFEFCGEFIRKYDLMRWGILKERLVRAQTRTRQLSTTGTAPEPTLDGKAIATYPYIFFKYRQDDSFLHPGAPASSKAYVFDGHVIGFDKNDVVPPDYGDNPRWVRKNPFLPDTGAPHLRNYQLYVNEDIIDIRHYWPIFQHNVISSNGALWNDLW